MTQQRHTGDITDVPP